MLEATDATRPFSHNFNNHIGVGNKASPTRKGRQGDGGRRETTPPRNRE
jgi:hypothetical protein